MRRFASLLLPGVILLTAYNPKQKPTQKGLNPLVRLYISVENNAMKVTNPTDTTITDDPVPIPREIVERTECFTFTEPGQELTGRPLGTDDVWKDYEHGHIVMWGGVIMNDLDNKKGRLGLNDYLLKVRDPCILTPTREGETENPMIVYISSKRMEDAEVAITKVYSEGNYSEVYRLFQELYAVIPMTTARWEAFKEEGSQWPPATQ